MNTSEKTTKKNPRVLMIVPGYPYPIIGGLEKQSHELAVALQRKSVTVNIISTRTNLAPNNFDTVDGIPVYRLPYPKTAWLKNLVMPFLLLRQMIVLRNRYDVVHVHQISWFGLYAILCAWLLNRPVMTKLANIGEKGIPGLIQSGFTGMMKLKILKLSRCIVAMTKESVRELAQINFPENQILLTPNGIQIRELEPKVQSEQGPHVVFIGRLVRQKGVSDLLHAWVKVQNEFPAARLSILGDGPELQALTEQSRQLKIDQTVAFHGHIDAAWQQLSHYDVFVLPSLMEGNSNAILEAMSAGLPIVASDVGGAKMQVGSAGAAWLVKASAPEILASKLTELFAKPAQMHQLGKSMQERIRQYFDIDVVANHYLQSYKLMQAKQYHKIRSASNPVMHTELL